MKFFARWLVSAASIYIIAHFLAGINVTGFEATLVAAAILGIVNTFIKPLLVLLTLPINIMSLGLFTLVINGIVLMATASVVGGLEVRGFLDAVIGSILISVVNVFISSLVGVKKK